MIRGERKAQRPSTHFNYSSFCGSKTSVVPHMPVHWTSLEGKNRSCSLIQMGKANFGVEA